MIRRGEVGRKLILVWLGMIVGGGALGFLELLLLDSHVELALGITILLAVCAGALVTRHLIAKHHQPLITVRDLRAR